MQEFNTCFNYDMFIKLSYSFIIINGMLQLIDWVKVFVSHNIK